MLLFERINNLEELAFSELFDSYNRKLHYYLKNSLNIIDPLKRQDAIQDSFVSIYKWLRKGNTFSNDNHIRDTLFLSSKRFIFNENYRVSILPKFTNEINEDSFNDFVEYEILDKVYQAAKSLPPEAKKIFELSYINDLETNEIAVLLNLSPQTVRNQRSRAIKLIRQKLSEGI